MNTLQAPLGPYRLPDLKFGYGDLSPVISLEALQIHHQQHHALHIGELNDALARHPEFLGLTIEDLLRKLPAVPSDIRGAVRYHGGGHANHQFFWKILRPGAASRPQGELAKALLSNFGSEEEFRAQFEEAGQSLFGSGWVFLVCRPKRNFELAIVTLPNNESLLTLEEPSPGLLACDLWEHAYYLDFRNRRHEWLRAWWDHVDWGYVAQRLQGIREGRSQL